MSFCTSCAREEGPGQRFCPACGAPSVTSPPASAFPTRIAEVPRRVGELDDPVWESGPGPTPLRSPLSRTSELADYGLRLAGWLLDFVIVSAVAIALLAALGMFHRTTTQLSTGLSSSHATSFTLSPLGSILWVVLVLLYVTTMIGARGQTLGMMATKIKAIRADHGHSVGYARALARGAIEFALLIMLFVPWVIDMLWPIWDQQNRTLHDLITGTVVIRAPAAIGQQRA